MLAISSGYRKLCVGEAVVSPRLLQIMQTTAWGARLQERRGCCMSFAFARSTAIG